MSEFQTLQAFLNVGVPVEQPPDELRGVVFKHQQDQALVDAEVTLGDPGLIALGVGGVAVGVVEAVVADHDQDGDLDVASCGYGSEWVRWYENDGTGRFKIHTLDEAQQSYDLRTIDMDGDGDLDLLNAGRGSNNVVWYENKLKQD